MSEAPKKQSTVNITVHTWVEEDGSTQKRVLMTINHQDGSGYFMMTPEEAFQVSSGLHSAAEAAKR